MSSERTTRYAIEVRDAKGGPLILTAVNWPDAERNVAVMAILQLIHRHRAVDEP